MEIHKSPLKLYPSATTVIANYLYLAGAHRVRNIINRLARLGTAEVKELLGEVDLHFGRRHRDIERILLKNFNIVAPYYAEEIENFDKEKKLLLGAFLTKEYSIHAAALFNPSIVPDPDQSGLKEGELRVILSLRATGEGHISSIVFRTGIISSDHHIILDTQPPYASILPLDEKATFTKTFLKRRLDHYAWYEDSLLENVPETFTALEILKSIESKHDQVDESTLQFRKAVHRVMDSNYDIASSPDISIGEKVIFPIAKSECMGMEDVRMVKFKDEGLTLYYATYTAYDGEAITSQLIETADFHNFKVRTLSGEAVSDKGMALFPEKINGQYAMISRQGGEAINIMFSSDLYRWDTYETLLTPFFTWELVQLGNCGSPVKTSSGWLLLTHGVGIMRTYVISAILLDLANPRKIIARLEKPLIRADETEREGYVPNVVYSCGSVIHNGYLVIPYAVSDSATGFVTVNLKELINEMTFK